MNVTYRLYRGGSNSVSMQSSKHGSNHSCSLSCSPAEAVKGEKEDGREREKEGGRERERESGRGREKERGREREKDGGRYRRGDRDSGKGKGEGGKEFGKDRERGRERDKSQLLSQYNILSQCQPSSQSQPQYFSEGQGQGQCFSPDVEFIAEDDATCLLRQSSGDFTPLSQHEGRWTEPVSDHARNIDALLRSIPSPLSSPLSLSHTLSANPPFTRCLSLSLTLSLSFSVSLSLSPSHFIFFQSLRIESGRLAIAPLSTHAITIIIVQVHHTDHLNHINIHLTHTHHNHLHSLFLILKGLIEMKRGIVIVIVIMISIMINIIFIIMMMMMMMMMTIIVTRHLIFTASTVLPPNLIYSMQTSVQTARSMLFKIQIQILAWVSVYRIIMEPILGYVHFYLISLLSFFI